MEKYFEKISRCLKRLDDVVILHEVPALDDTVINKLKDFCKDKYQLLRPLAGNNARNFETVVICKLSAKMPVYELDETYRQSVYSVFENYLNRIIVVHSQKKDKLIVGIHIPMNCAEYWDSLIKLHSLLPKDRPIIYIGDINTFKPNTINKRKMYEFMSKGLVDFWLEKGKTHTEQTFKDGSRLDYVFITGKHCNKYRFEVHNYDNKEVMGELSDHSALMLGLPKELEPFKKGD